MQVIHKIRAVNRIYRQVDRQVLEFREKSGLQCIPGCGKCCLKADIETTVLEFLPAAWSLYRSGKYPDLITRMDHITDKVCVFYNPFGEEGCCSVYGERGLICRLFGFSSRVDKYGDCILVTCNAIKNMNRKPGFDKAVGLAPEISSCYMKLYGIDPGLSMPYFPINESIRKALDIVLLNTQYRKRRA